MNSATTLPGNTFAPQSTSVAGPRITDDQLATLRAAVRTDTQRGRTAQQINAALKPWGVTMSQVMSPTGTDFARAGAQGLTLNHADEITGLLAKLAGGNYEQTRDQSRFNDDQSRAANPWTMGATSAAGASLPAVVASLIPGLQPVASEMWANAGRGALVGAGMGAVGGEGASTSTTMGGMATDAALGGMMGGAVGGVAGGVGSKIMDMIAGKATKGAVANVTAASGSQVPANALDVGTIVTRQNALAPGTVVVADIAPGLRKTAADVIAADPKTAMMARDAAQARLRQLSAARRAVGTAYDVTGRVPVDPTIAQAMDAAGAKIGAKAKTIDIQDVIQARQNIGKQVGNPLTRFQKGQAYDGLTAWLEQHIPNIREVDANYAFLTDRHKAASQTLTALARSSASGASRTARGSEAVGVGRGAPLILPTSGPGATITTVVKATTPSQAARARAAADLLLNPERTQDALRSIYMARQNLLAGAEQRPGLGALSAILGGAVTPQVTRP